MFLKENIYRSIKVRTVAIGNKQKYFISKDYSSSPTVATEAVLLSFIVNSEEKGGVDVIDIPSAFFHTRVEN